MAVKNPSTYVHNYSYKFNKILTECGVIQCMYSTAVMYVMFSLHYVIQTDLPTLYTYIHMYIQYFGEQVENSRLPNPCCWPYCSK